MGTRNLSIGVLLVLVVTLGSGAHAGARSERITASVGGRAIPIGTIASYHCHDLRYPAVRCFRTAAAVRRDITAIIGRPRAGSPGSAGTQAAAYVRVFEHSNYEGNSMYLSQDHDNLGTIGWNDRVSSFKVVNGGSGVFREHAGPSGASYAFCCAQNVATLGSWNDAFSAASGVA